MNQLELQETPDGKERMYYVNLITALMKVRDELLEKYDLSFLLDNDEFLKDIGL